MIGIQARDPGALAYCHRRPSRAKDAFDQPVVPIVATASEAMRGQPRAAKACDPHRAGKKMATKRCGPAGICYSPYRLRLL
jgi:hypothetical protein